jgi:hypothetical protein
MKSKERTFEGERGTDRDNRIHTNYDDDINKAKSARINQYHDTDPMIEKEGFLGVDDLDKMRRRKIR